MADAEASSKVKVELLIAGISRGLLSGIHINPSI
jgi:hypothetical protein